MAASGQASAKRVCFFWPFLFSVSGRGKLLLSFFVSTGITAERGKLPPADFGTAI